MMKTIDFKTFRTNNHLSQEECCQFLDVTKSFISQVENGRSKLSKEKIHLLLNSDYETRGLVPCFDRLEKVMELFSISIYDIGQQTYNLIRYGEIPFPNELANRLVERYPELNFDWLITGIGRVLLENPDVPNLAETLRQMNHRLSGIESFLSANTHIDDTPITGENLEEHGWEIDENYFMWHHEPKYLKEFNVNGKTLHCVLDDMSSNTVGRRWNVHVDNNRFEGVGSMDVATYGQIDKFLKLLTE